MMPLASNTILDGFSQSLVLVLCACVCVCGGGGASWCCTDFESSSRGADSFSPACLE